MKYCSNDSTNCFSFILRTLYECFYYHTLPQKSWKCRLCIRFSIMLEVGLSHDSGWRYIFPDVYHFRDVFPWSSKITVPSAITNPMPFRCPLYDLNEKHGMQPIWQEAYTYIHSTRLPVSRHLGFHTPTVHRSLMQDSCLGHVFERQAADLWIGPFQRQSPLLPFVPDCLSPLRRR